MLLVKYFLLEHHGNKYLYIFLCHSGAIAATAAEVVLVSAASQEGTSTCSKTWDFFGCSCLVAATKQNGPSFPHMRMVVKEKL